MSDTTVVKVTKRDRFVELVAIAEAAERADLVEFLNDQIASLDKRAEKAKETRAKKKAESDTLTETLRGLLTDEPQTISDITAALGDETVTNAKVSVRLSALAKAGEITKGEVTVTPEDGGKARRLVAYSL